MREGRHAKAAKINSLRLGLAQRQAWYRCLEHVKEPNKPIEKINKKKNYKLLTDETGIKLKDVRASWYKGYDFFDEEPFNQPETWRKKQIIKWVNEYGFEYFMDLDLSGLFIQS